MPLSLWSVVRLSLQYSQLYMRYLLSRSEVEVMLPLVEALNLTPRLLSWPEKTLLSLMLQWVAGLY